MKRQVTGERLETFIYDESTIEHLHRYAMAREWVKDKNVLDIASGAGYGSNLLAGWAKSVVGVDKDDHSIQVASSTYKRTNLTFRQGLVDKIPANDNSFDVVVSFETLEHTHNHQEMLTEIKRVLSPGGIVIISTPDRTNYSDKRHYKNPYHLKELHEEEFKNLVKSFFLNCHFLGQKLMLASVITTGGKSDLIFYEGKYDHLNRMEGIEPMYHIAIASDQPLVVSESSLFLGEGTLQSALEEKEKEWKSLPSYRLGHFLLLPAKWVRSIFK